MGRNSKIEWTQDTWNPVTGCSVVSPGCTNCYAMRLAGTRLRNHATREGLTRDTKAGPVWTGDVRFNARALTDPLRWSKPRMIFVCAHGDLFHENVPDEWIDRIFAVMALCPQHTFQVLTKRSARMRAYVESGACRVIKLGANGNTSIVVSTAEAYVSRAFLDDKPVWPLPNVWLGVSAEDQTRADERIPDLLATPAAVRWVSAEPLLGPIDFSFVPWPADRARFPETDDLSDGRHGLHDINGSRIDWIVVGGESGPHARPMHPQWARDIRDQCDAANVPFFFKQHGEWLGLPDDRREIISTPNDLTHDWEDTCAYRVGKKRAGRLLDGREHNDMPRIAA